MGEDEPKYVLEHDKTNAAILPVKQKKKQSSIKRDGRGRVISTGKSKTPLTKKQIKHLKKVVERKEKATERVGLLESLSKHQITSDELSQLESIATMQTKGTKRHIGKSKKVPNSVGLSKLAKKAKLNAALADEELKFNISANDPSGYVSSSTSDYDGDVDEGQHNDTERRHSADDDDVTVIATESPVISTEIVKNDEVQALPPVNLKNVAVNRLENIQIARLKLPILAEEQQIVEAVHYNSVVILCGETGSGKTTQLPQFLYEAGYCNANRLIGVTEPRRVAAISSSMRVAEELGPDLPKGSVAYQIRYEGNVNENTCIKFMTDGVLLREIHQDFLLSRYSVVMIDEAHERSMYSDILLGLLSRIVPQRLKRTPDNPLKLIVMSATLRVEDFQQPKLFKQEPKLIKVESRQYPVTVYFNRTTPENYLMEAYRKVCKIHKVLPEGGILVFVSGQREVFTLINWLKRTFPLARKATAVSNGGELRFSDAEDEEDVETAVESAAKLKRLKRKKQRKKKLAVKDVPKIRLDNYDVVDPAVSALTTDEMFDTNDVLDDDDLELLADDEQVEMMENSLYEPTQNLPLFCLPMFSLLPTKKQQRVFQSNPIGGSRFCVIATNVAETSLTIPGIRYVVDTGKVKQRIFDAVTGVSQFRVDWVSQASANQRAGRAGRLGPGHCYRLFSSAVFTDFAKHSIPEIMNKPVDELVLHMKNMNITKVINFPFPSAPSMAALAAAEQRLIKLGALEIKELAGDFEKLNELDALELAKKSSKITDLGKTIATLPVIPSFGKMLALGHQQDLLPYVIALVAALSVREPLTNLSSLAHDPNKDDETTIIDDEKVNQAAKLMRRRQLWADRGQSLLLGDLSVLLKAVGAAEYEQNSDTFCIENGLLPKAMMEIRKLRRQLTNFLALQESSDEMGGGSALKFDPLMQPPTEKHSLLIRQIILAGLPDKVARKAVAPQEEGAPQPPKNAYECSSFSGFVFLHPFSVLKKSQPELVVYQEVIEMAIDGRRYLQNVCAIDPEWLHRYAEAYCNFGPPIESAGPPKYEPKYDSVTCHRKITFGPSAWLLPSTTRSRHPLNIQYYRYICVALLDGSLCPKLRPYTQFLLASPKTMLKEWAKNHRRTERLLSAIVAKDIDSIQTLEEVWKEGVAFLCVEYLEWLPEKLHTEIQLLWPPLTD